MTIKIDRSIFMDRIDSKTRRRTLFAENKAQTSSLIDESLLLCQKWMDDEVYKSITPMYGASIGQKDCKRSLYGYVIENMDLRSRKKSYFVPTFIWVWIAQQLIAYIVKLIIEHYWLSDSSDSSLFYLTK